MLNISEDVASKQQSGELKSLLKLSDTVQLAQSAGGEC